MPISTHPSRLICPCASTIRCPWGALSTNMRSAGTPPMMAPHEKPMMAYTMQAYTNNSVKRVYSLSLIPGRAAGVSVILSILVVYGCTFLSHIAILRLPCRRRPNLYHLIDKAGAPLQRQAGIGRTLGGFQLRQKNGEGMQVLVGQSGHIVRSLGRTMVHRLRPIGGLRLMQEGNQIIQSAPGAYAVQAHAVVGAITHRAMTVRAA